MKLSCIYESMDTKLQRKPIEFKMVESKSLELPNQDSCCWICTSHSIAHNRNYPRVERDGKKDYIHRYIYRRFCGEIPKGMVVRHKCDNTLCINPNHLELGTQRDNMLDMTKRNRRVVGKQHGNAKLTEEIAREIKYSDKSGKHFAEKYGISPSVISTIRKGGAWKHV